MSKRINIGMLAAVGVMVMWWAHAEAATCVQYRTIGGSSVCSAWSTKGVQVSVDFNQSCGSGGENCNASASAQTTDSIAFCQNTTTNVITKRETSLLVTFAGNSSSNPDGCVPKHDQDGTDTNGVGHLHHGCTATFTLVTGTCPTSPSLTQGPCNAGEVCLDLTPIEMETTILANVGFGEIDFLEAPAATSEGPGCSSTSSFSTCEFQETCSINPKKIALITNPADGRQYQCNLDCAGTSCGGDD